MITEAIEIEVHTVRLLFDPGKPERCRLIGRHAGQSFEVNFDQGATVIPGDMVRIEPLAEGEAVHRCRITAKRAA